MPTPAASPLNAGSLLAATEGEEGEGAAPCSRADADDIPVISATTHAATAASAEVGLAAAAAGGALWWESN